MPKGHSKLQTDIERQFNVINPDLYARAVNAEARIAILERRIGEMNEAFSRAAFPRAPQQVVQNGNPQTPIPS